MAPIRRYLRITKYSVLEVRIYLEKPSDAPWLLSSREPILPRIIKEIRPKVLPKLREENENSRKKGSKKKKGIKDVVTHEDFEVVLFLTDSTTRHSLITKHKQFADKPPITSTSEKLTGWLNDAPITIEDDNPPVLLREESDEIPKLADVPEIDQEALFVSSDEEPFEAAPKQSKRRSRARKDQNEDDKKKLAMNTSYDGFSMYGKILCLIVKRKGTKKQQPTTGTSTLNGSELMESWVSTQINQQADLEDEGA